MADLLSDLQLRMSETKTMSWATVARLKLIERDIPILVSAKPAIQDCN